MLDTYMIYFIPISCIHNNLSNTFKFENGSLFYFILFYVSFILKLCTKKKNYVLKITYQTPLNMKMYYYYYFFYIQDLNVK